MHTEVLRNSWVGQQIDERLPLHEWLGSIGSGDIFRTELPQSQPAAILLTTAEAENADEQLQNWASAAELNHPHLLRVFEHGRTRMEDCDLLYLVTELPEEALGQVLPERPLTPDETREMLTPILAALNYLHSQGLVHGRLEPANVLVVGDQLKLSIDSLLSAGSARHNAERLRIYDAPENARGPLTPAADVWALGVTIVEALTQQTPGWMRGSYRDPLIPVTVPQPFAEIARRCLRLDPAQRCSLADIAAILNPSTQTAIEQTAEVVDEVMNVPELMAPVVVEEIAQVPFAPEPEVDSYASAPAEPQPHLRRLRAVEEEDTSPLQFRPPMLIGAAVLLLLLIVGLFAYSHRSKSAVAHNEPSAREKNGEPKAIAPLPEPHGPTVKGEVAQRVVPEIPERAARGIRGQVDVMIRVVVDHSGGVMNASIESAGRNRYFANQALDAARRWQFRPAKLRGQAASSVWQIQFVFRKNGTEVTPVEITP